MTTPGQENSKQSKKLQRAATAALEAVSQPEAEELDSSKILAGLLFGNPEICFKVGLAHYQGIGVERGGAPKDDIKAMELFKKAAAKGHLEATYMIGVLYDLGQGVPAKVANNKVLRKEEALKYYKQAAEGGHSEAQATLGARLINGKGAPADMPGGISWLRAAAKQNNQMAQASLLALNKLGYQNVGQDEAKKLLRQIGGEAGLKETWATIRTAAEEGATKNAGADLVCTSDKTKIPNKSPFSKLSLAKQAAEQGCIDMQWSLFLVYSEGISFVGDDPITEDKAEALRWLRKAAAANHPRAQYVLGTCYLHGKYGVVPDSKAAEYHLRNAARLGSQQALLMLAVHFDHTGDTEAALNLNLALLFDENDPIDENIPADEPSKELAADAKPATPVSSTLASPIISDTPSHEPVKKYWRKGLFNQLVRLAKVRTFFEDQKNEKAVAEIIKIGEDLGKEFAQLDIYIAEVEKTVWPSLQTIALRLDKEKGIERRISELEQHKKEKEQQAKSKPSSPPRATKAPKASTPALPAKKAESKPIVPPKTVEEEKIIPQLEAAIADLAKTLALSRAAHAESSVKRLVDKREALIGEITKIFEFASYCNAASLGKFRALYDSRAVQGRNFLWHDNNLLPPITKFNQKNSEEQLTHIEKMADALCEHLTIRLANAKTPSKNGSSKKKKSYADHLHYPHPLLQTVLTTDINETNYQSQLVFSLATIRLRVRDQDPLAIKAFARALGRAEALFTYLEFNNPEAYSSKQARQHQVIKALSLRIRHPDLLIMPEEFENMLKRERIASANKLTKMLTSASSTATFVEEAKEKNDVAPAPQPSSAPISIIELMKLFNREAAMPKDASLQYQEEGNILEITAEEKHEANLNKVRDYLTDANLIQEKNGQKGDFRKIKITDETTGSKTVKFSLQILKSRLHQHGLLKNLNSISANSPLNAAGSMITDPNNEPISVTGVTPSTNTLASTRAFIS